MLQIKKALCIALLLACGTPIMALSINDGTAPTAWQDLWVNDQVVVQYKYADCDLEAGFDQQWVLLRIENRSNAPLTISWDLQLWFNNACKTCDDANGEYHKSIVVEAGTSVEGHCSLKSNRNLSFFSKFTTRDNRTILTDFKLANLTLN